MREGTSAVAAAMVKAPPMLRRLRGPCAWGLFLVLGACRGRAAPPEPTTSTPKTEAPASASVSGTPAVSDGAAPLDGGSDGGPPPSVAQVVTRGTRVILVDGGKVLAQRPKGQVAPLVLAPAPRDKDAKLSATMGPFLGHAGLLDVTIVESSEHGWHHESRETHYVLDTAGASDVLACVFVGATHSGGEYASTATSIGIKQAAPKPLAFDVARTTTSRATQPRGHSKAPETTTLVDHFELGAASCANAAQPP